jgi:AcrR family transcriptional regulator
MEAEPGLRARKKQRTRELISETARRLFVERGFDAVPVAEVARAAEVSEATVFNYFPTKEDLVFQGMETFETDLLRVVRDRPPGQSILAAFSSFVLEPRGFLAADDKTSAEDLIGMARMMATSPALLVREGEILVRYAASLGALLAEEMAAPSDDLQPWTVAHALMGIHRALIDLVRVRLGQGSTDRAVLAREVKTQGQRAVMILEQGLADYGVKAAPRPRPRSRSG